MFTLASMVITFLFCEALTQIKTMKTFRNTRYYIFKYLAVNLQKVTLEHYLLKQFFPKYLGILFGAFSLTLAGHYFMKGADPYICVVIIIAVLLLRVYNRTIFSDLWNELSRTQ